MVARLLNFLPYALGFFLVANGTIASAGAASVRMTDLFAPALGLLVLTGRIRAPFGWVPFAAVFALVFLPIVWTVLAFFGISDRTTLALGARWLLAAPWALALFSICARESGRARFVKGLVLGCLFNVLVVIAQHYDLDGPLQRIGFSSYGDRLIWVGQQLRLPGLHGSPSSSSAVISLLAPAVLWLYLRRHVNALWPLVAFVAAGIGLHLTSSRSPLVMIGLSSLLAMVVTFTTRRALLLWAAGLLVGLPLLVAVGPPGGWVRWTDTGDMAMNVSDRLLSNLSTLELVARHPLGMGAEAGERALFEDTGIQATHNAWLQSALIFGLPMALAIGLAFAVHVFRLRFGWRSDAYWPALVAFHLAGLFVFEEHLNNPTFIILTSWLVVAATLPARPRSQSMRAP